MASMASPTEPEPDASRNFSAMIRVVQLTPVTPMLLFPTAPIVPDVCVPWPASSAGSHEDVIALKPCDPAGHVIGPLERVTVNVAGADHMLAARSGCVYWTPVSTTP